jgi:hypothetical protein
VGCGAWSMRWEGGANQWYAELLSAKVKMSRLHIRCLSPTPRSRTTFAGVRAVGPSPRVADAVHHQQEDHQDVVDIVPVHADKEQLELDAGDLRGFV